MKVKINKSLSYLLAFLVMIAFISIQPLTAKAEEGLNIEAESAILVDTETGKILYSKNPEMTLPPASMTKMMTEYLVLEAIESGDISWDTTTQISDYPYNLSANPNFSGVGLRQNADYTVRSLYEAMAINSDNATTIALAELVAGSEGEFVKLMNQKAEELGLPESEYKFVNTTGLENSSLGENYPEGTDPDATNLLSARASALLAYHLVNDHPESLEISQIPQIEFDGHTINNWNRMLPHEGDNFKQFYYEGIDGLKTGHTDLAGYSFTGTAERDGVRLISVVMKTDREEQRFKETAKLFDYGYTQFETKEVFPAGYQLEDQATISVEKGKQKTAEIATNSAFYVPVKEEEIENYSIEYRFDEKLFNNEGELTAPLEKGQKIGTAELVYHGEKDYGYIIDETDQKVVDLVTIEAVEKNNWFMIALGAIGDFFADLFTSIVDIVKGWFK